MTQHFDKPFKAGTSTGFKTPQGQKSQPGGHSSSSPKGGQPLDKNLPKKSWDNKIIKK